MNWVIKDGLGQAGGIVFAAWLGRRKGMDANPKKWRTVSAMAMDGATFLEILSPLVPGHFLAVASLANIGKNIAFLSASASRAAIHNNFAINQNLADITAKAGSQSIFASLAGTAVGVTMSPFVGSEWSDVALGFAVLSVLHQTCTYFALRAVPLKTLNRERLQHVIRHFLDNNKHTADKKSRVKAQILSPDDVAGMEMFLQWPYWARRYFHRDNQSAFRWLNTSIDDVNDILPDGKLETSDGATMFQKGFLLRYDETRGIVHVGFLETADATAVLAAFFQAQIMKDLSDMQPSGKVAELASRRAAAEFPTFLAALQTAGWDCNWTFVEPHHVRFDLKHA